MNLFSTNRNHLAQKEFWPSGFTKRIWTSQNGGDPTTYLFAHLQCILKICIKAQSYLVWADPSADQKVYDLRFIYTETDFRCGGSEINGTKL